MFQAWLLLPRLKSHDAGIASKDSHSISCKHSNLRVALDLFNFKCTVAALLAECLKQCLKEFVRK
jgi:hypothetical protein